MLEGGEAGRHKVPTRDSGTGMGAAEYPPPPPPPNADGTVSRAGSEAGDAMDPQLQARERHLAMQEKIRSGAPTLLSPEPLEDLNQKPKQVDSPDLSREIARVEAQFKKVHPVTPTGVSLSHSLTTTQHGRRRRRWSSDSLNTVSRQHSSRRSLMRPGRP